MERPASWGKVLHDTFPRPGEAEALAKVAARVRRYTFLALAVWTVLLALSLGWNITKQREITQELATNTARANFNKDMAYRLWASSHGGVYVEPTEKTPPSPWMAHLPDRDLITTDGRMLTLMNPAYMLREMMQDYGDLYGIKGRIVGIVTLNPANTADPWEADGIRQFSAGTRQEILEVADIDGAPYLRLLRPFRMEPSCQKCHGHLGFQDGEVRGAIGVSVPLAPYRASEAGVVVTMAASHAILWLLGGIAIILIAFRSHSRQMAAERLTQALRDKNEALQRSNDDLEAYAYVASHDLREPLRNVTSFSTLLARRLGGRLDEEEEEIIRIVGDAASRMDGLVRGLLEVSRVGRDAQPPQPVSLARVVDSACSSLQRQMEESEASFHLLAPLPQVQGNEDELYRLFLNLFANALRYKGSPPLRVIIDCAPEAPGDWRITVADNGIGIEPGHGYEERIFGLFQRLHQRDAYGGGTGIGLPICRKIVTRHGGRIWAESDGPGKGTRFILTLPRMPD